MTEKTKQRLAYVDWMRGLACLLMFQTHCYDSWLSSGARASKFFMWSQLGGTLPAPLFLFLAGVSLALVPDKLRQGGATAHDVACKTMRRGAEIFALGLLFRVQEFLLGQPWAPWSDLLRVDILNMIGFSMLLMGLICRAAAAGETETPAGGRSEQSRVRARNIVAALALVLFIALVTPPVWTTWRPSWLPWFLESYINGVHTFATPQPWLFPFFPWAAFALVGLAVGFVLLTDWARHPEVSALALLALGGAAVAMLALRLDTRPRQFYAVYDFWHTSPNFFFIRVGILLVILFGSYAWCRWGPGLWGFSPLVQM